MSTQKQIDQVAALIKVMKKRKLTLATAESITGGGLASAITDVAGSSAIFLGSMVTYSDASKTKILGIPKRILTKSTAVSLKSLHNRWQSRHGLNLAQILRLRRPVLLAPERPMARRLARSGSRLHLKKRR